MRSNKYSAPCVACRATVPAGEGVLERVSGRWEVRHAVCGETPDPVGLKPQWEPTSEQRQALSLFDLGADLVIEAGAGTGKTSTLRLLADADPKAKIQYIAFNRAIVDEAKTKFPANVSANTAHSLAYAAVGRKFQHRLSNSVRQSSREVARFLEIESLEVGVPVEGGEPGQVEGKLLSTEFLASLALDTVRRFCHSADPEITSRHVPYIEGIDTPANGERTWSNNRVVADLIVPSAVAAWDDLQRPDGTLRFLHDHYLKIWQLSGPRINADVILFDEGQDANPVIAAVVAAQDHAQIVHVGDSQQAIYEFTGAINTLSMIDIEHRAYLTQSFRFGPQIAEVANRVLSRLDADLRLTGTPSIESTVAELDRPDALLCRTNAAAVEAVIRAKEDGLRAHLVGGGQEVTSFAAAARSLQAGQRTTHQELACFTSWADVQTYVANDRQGSDLKLLVSLVDRFGAGGIITALECQPSEANADLVVSTAHKAKGREWDAVKIAGDFPSGDPEQENAIPVTDAELRLLYVACTRARLSLDISNVELFHRL